MKLFDGVDNCDSNELVDNDDDLVCDDDLELLFVDDFERDVSVLTVLEEVIELEWLIDGPLVILGKFKGVRL